MLPNLATAVIFVSSILSATSAAPAPKPRASIGANNDQWVWVPVPGTMCADGSVTGFAISTHQGSTDVLINFEEGGLCYDYASCYQNNRAWNIPSGYNAASFASESRADQLNSYSLTTRYTSDNPFYQANMAWVPYCTGDLHAGNATNTYAPNTTPTYHHGYINGQLIMQAIKATLPSTQRVWVTGSSAGGFGAVYQYPNAVAIFGADKRIDLIVDSAISSGSAYFQSSLNIQVPSKSACPGCNPSKFDSFLPALAAVRPNSRFAGLAFRTDDVLPGYEGVSSLSITLETVTSFASLSVARNAKTFMARGDGHVVFGSPLTPSVLGTSLSSFITNMVNAATWLG